ncbi:Protein kinase, ATP binding site-containing protein [Artemisia annua]|uniref:Protein kinase, ATP binding site-containing protein n=1 Tax=Artemisia annua TaxID=35608 RepID=A0A2U1M826_ARTAN|nr:Protein kinase, ATP binding site-containing protein [Artemisia annua]
MAPFWNEFQHLEIQLQDIKLATNNFDENKVIGSGGFGKVYRGEISLSMGRRMVAFKRLDRKFGQGDLEFWKEIMMLSRYTHENLISLLGFCKEEDEMIIVYEYAARGSLDRYLHDANLTWRQRLKICLDAARGLSYLHDDKGTRQREQMDSSSLEMFSDIAYRCLHKYRQERPTMTCVAEKLEIALKIQESSEAEVSPQINHQALFIRASLFLQDLRARGVAALHGLAASLDGRLRNDVLDMITYLLILLLPKAPGHSDFLDTYDHKSLLAVVICVGMFGAICAAERISTRVVQYPVFKSLARAVRNSELENTRCRRTIMLEFHIVKSTSKYNVILGRTTLQKLSMEVLTMRSLVEFPTRAGIATVKSDYPGKDASLAAAVEESNIREIAWEPISGDHHNRSQPPTSRFHF